jgi:serine/threonine-protein kinase
MSAVVHSKKDVQIPDLSGKTIDDSVSILSSLNLGVKKDGEEFNENMPAGIIIRQNPAAGMTVKEGKIVRVTVSQGGEMLYVPNLVGQTSRAAEIAIRTAGLTLGEESTRYSLVADKDRVLSQDPAAGSGAEKDALVNLVLSAGRPPANMKLMPPFVGKDVRDAKNWADQNRINAVMQEENAPEARPGSVLRQEPEPDTDLANINTVTFFVAETGSGSGAAGKIFSYDVPGGSGEKDIRMTLRDDNGETEVFRGKRVAGTRLDVPVNPRGSARVRIFINGILVEEREVR